MGIKHCVIFPLTDDIPNYTVILPHNPMYRKCVFIPIDRRSSHCLTILPHYPMGIMLRLTWHEYRQGSYLHPISQWWTY